MDETRNTERAFESPQNIDGAPEFSPEEPSHSPVGAIIGSVVLFALLVIGALYLYGAQLNNSENLETANPSTDESTNTHDGNERDDLDSLEEELEALGGFEEIGEELESSFEAEFGD